MARVAQNGFLGADFGFGVNAQRIRRVSFDVISFEAVENEVGGKKDEWNFGGEFGKKYRGVGIDAASHSGIGVANGIFADGCAVNDGGRFFRSEQFANAVEVEEIDVAASKAARRIVD